ncbi:MAG: hypothetical protein AAF443_07565 [Chlamydiota bacterium]
MSKGKWDLTRISHKALEKFGASVFRVFQGALLEMVTTIPCKISIKNLEKHLARISHKLC